MSLHSKLIIVRWNFDLEDGDEDGDEDGAEELMCACAIYDQMVLNGAKRFGYVTEFDYYIERDIFSTLFNLCGEHGLIAASDAAGLLSYMEEHKQI